MFKSETLRIVSVGQSWKLTMGFPVGAHEPRRRWVEDGKCNRIFTKLVGAENTALQVGVLPSLCMRRIGHRCLSAFGTQESLESIDYYVYQLTSL